LLPHASANKPEQRAHAEPNGLEGNASVTAGTEAGIASGFSNALPETSTEALPTTRRELGIPLPAGDTPAKLASALRPPAPMPWAESTEPVWPAIAAKIPYAGSDSSSDGAFEAAAAASVDLTSWRDSDLDSFDVDLPDATGCAGRLEDAPQALAPIVEETAGGIAALAPAGDKRAGVDDAAALEAAADPADTTEDGLPPAPAQLHSSSCAFPASSMSPGGVYEISGTVFAGYTLERGFASNCYDSPGRGGADGTGAEEPNYVPDKANQDQKPGGFSLATGRPPGDTAAGALLILAGAPKLECTGRPPGGAAAGALWTGAGGAAAGALLAGVIKLESERGLLDHAAAGAPSADAIIKLESTGRPPDDAAADTLSAGANELESRRGPPGGAAAGALSAGAIKLESVYGLLDHAAADTLSAGAIIKLKSTGRPLDDAAADTLSAGANEPESKRGRLGHTAADELSTGRLRPPGNAPAGALSVSATKLKITGRPPGGAATGALSSCVTKLKGTHHSISNVAQTRSRPAPMRSRARAARSAMRPPTRARPTAHKFSGDTSTNYARRAKSIERRAAAKNTAGAC